MDVQGVSLSYEVHGAGPCVVVPRCNVGWDDVDLGSLTDWTVVVVSPRGFGASDRPGWAYDAGTVRTDVEAVLDHLGIQQYAALGYSMTGAVAAWLAHDNPRVRAVVCGGFPAASSYARVLPHVVENHREAERDGARWAEVTQEYDPDALLAWWRLLDALPPGALVDRVDRVACPVHLFWGDQDEVIDGLVGLGTAATEAGARDLPGHVLPGLDHEGGLEHLDEAVRSLRPWLREVWPGAEARSGPPV